MRVQFKILVLNSDSLAAVNVCDDRISHGFVYHQNFNTVADFVRSTAFNSLMVTPQSCSDHVGFDISDLRQLCYQVIMTSKQQATFKADVTSWELLRFYSIAEGANFNSDYIKEHFDGILFFLHDELTEQVSLNESVVTLLSSDQCPPFMVFNLQASSLDLKLFEPSVLFFLQKVLPRAQMVTLTAPNNKDQELKIWQDFYHSLNTSMPKFQVSLNGYMYFKRASIARSLVNTYALEQVLAGCATTTIQPSEDDSPSVQSLIIPYEHFKHPHIVLVSSSLLVAHIVLGMSPYGASLLRRVHDAFPNSSIVVLLDEVSYSYLTELKEHSVLTKKYERTLAKVDSHEQGALGELSDKIVNKLNDIVASLIKVELFKEHCPEHLPLDQALDGSLYDEELFHQVERYSHIIDKCYLSCSYRDFATLNADVVISEHPYEQMLALSHGVSCLALDNDLDELCEFSERDYAIFKASNSDFNDLFYDLYELDYQVLQRQGLTRLFYRIGKYGSWKQEALRCLQLLRAHSLKQVLSYGFTKLQERDLSSLNDNLQLLYQEAQAFYKPFQDLLFLLKEGKLKLSQDAARKISAAHMGYQVAQFSNYTSINRYAVQWQFLKYFTSAFTHIQALSFGCAAGQEVCQLAHLFSNQNITGCDINSDALNSAVQLIRNLQLDIDSGKQCEIDGDFTSISYLGSHAKVRLAYAPHLIKSSPESFNVVAAMTVLCRHPQTLGIKSSEGIYSFSEFESLLHHLDSLVAPHGLLCLFNANYRLEDSVLKDKYIRLFPFAPQTKLLTQGDLESSLAYYLSGSNSLVLPPNLLALYNNADYQDKFGYVATFGPDHQSFLGVDKGTIFLKVAP